MGNVPRHLQSLEYYCADDAAMTTKRSMVSSVTGEGLEITTDHLGLFWKTFVSIVVGSDSL
jgi:hypothetical protein